MGRTAAQFSELQSLVQQCFLDRDKDDGWEWTFDTQNGFTVKKLSQIIDGVIFGRENNNVESLRNRLVPKKIEVFIWRARRGRIPVRVELDKRGIDLHSLRCPVCDGDIETVEHILFTCNFAKEVWLKVLKWWGYGSSIFGYEDIFLGTFGSSAFDNKRKIWQAVCWIVCYLSQGALKTETETRKACQVGVVAQARGQPPVTNQTPLYPSIPSLLMEIQSLSFDWISRRHKKHKMDWHSWFNNP
ncbi:uncharacterized protein [Rutidosis leptorrhynchoides]|uniref:uncharacterized protein n=1 Tax=Rutidosis leptorrhynchoides TaxID=125765 RepID=UPI003A99CE54